RVGGFTHHPLRSTLAAPGAQLRTHFSPPSWAAPPPPQKNHTSSRQPGARAPRSRKTPLVVPEDRDVRAPALDAFDLHVWAADHEIRVHGRLVVGPLGKLDVRVPRKSETGAVGDVTGR